MEPKYFAFRLGDWTPEMLIILWQYDGWRLQGGPKKTVRSRIPNHSTLQRWNVRPFLGFRTPFKTGSVAFLAGINKALTHFSFSLRIFLVLLAVVQDWNWINGRNRNSTIASWLKKIFSIVTVSLPEGTEKRSIWGATKKNYGFSQAPEFLQDSFKCLSIQNWVHAVTYSHWTRRHNDGRLSVSD